MTSDNKELLEQAEKLLNEPSACDCLTIDMLAQFVELWGWQRTLSDLTQVADRRKDGRVFGIMQAAVQFMETEGGESKGLHT